MLPHHRPFTQMSLRQLAHYQRLTLDRDSYTIRWWHAYRHSPRTLANGRTVRVSVAGFPYCLGGRMPHEVCWHYHHRHWTLPLYHRTLVRLHPPVTLPWAFWDCVATGRLNGRQVSSGEGGATSYNPAGPWYGRYQMDSSFMAHWGADMLSKYGGRDARAWSVVDQTIVAERGFGGQGPMAWPNTAPPCLSLRH